MDSSTFWPCWVQLSGVGQRCHSVPEVSLWQHWDLPTGTVWRQENGPRTRKSFQWIKPCNCPLWHRASFTNAKCSKCRIIIFLQPKKGCNLPEVPWKVKDELGSESRSPDQTKLFTKLSCPQRLKSCFLKTIATPPKNSSYTYSTYSVPGTLHIHSFIPFPNNSESYVLLSFPF